MKRLTKRLTEEDLDDIADLFADAAVAIELREAKPNLDALHTRAALDYAAKRLNKLAVEFYDKAADKAANKAAKENEP